MFSGEWYTYLLLEADASLGCQWDVAVMETLSLSAEEASPALTNSLPAKVVESSVPCLLCAITVLTAVLTSALRCTKLLPDYRHHSLDR